MLQAAGDRGGVRTSGGRTLSVVGAEVAWRPHVSMATPALIAPEALTPASWAWGHGAGTSTMPRPPPGHARPRSLRPCQLGTELP
jgi:hypothetical protein